MKYYDAVWHKWPEDQGGLRSFSRYWVIAKDKTHNYLGTAYYDMTEGKWKGVYGGSLGSVLAWAEYYEPNLYNGILEERSDIE